MQDWQLNNGRIECISSGGDRNVFLLTHELIDNSGNLQMSVRLGRIAGDSSTLDKGWVGFKVGVRGQFNDYRDSALRGKGLCMGLHTSGRLFIGSMDQSAENIVKTFDDIRLVLRASESLGKYDLVLCAYNADNRELARITRNNVDSDWLIGSVALVCSSVDVLQKKFPAGRSPINDGNWGMRSGTKRGGNVNFWFKDWQVKGSKVKQYPGREFGPILFAQHTLSNNIMKMTAQMPPIGESDAQSVGFQIKNRGKWQTIAQADIDALARTAAWRIENWNSTKDIPYRLVYKMRDSSGALQDHYFTGTVRKDPVDKESLVVAAFTGNNDLGFPNNDFVKHVEYQNPDLLFFSGDQIYEGVGGYGAQRSPLDKSCLDYLRKWYLYGWAYKDLLRNIPAISIPDDHDVYHGNIWGASGKPTDKGLNGAAAQDSGGYKMPAEWVNMVQRTQTSSLPDPYDPRPVQQGIGVYFCNLNYGGVSFAVIEDRKFKSAPKPMLPKAKIWNGWPQNRDFNAETKADISGAVLLGERQLDFLNHWSADWPEGVYMKVLLSQTIFANAATLPRKEISDAAVPRLRILKAGEYAPDDMPVSDFDSDAWPQTGRNKAVKAIRRGFAFHIAGDQHLGSFTRYGVDQWRDSGFAFCVPSVSNVWPRRWYPSQRSKNPIPGEPRYTGDFKDGFGNKITVYAVSNPIFTGLKPSRLYDRATGYGICRFNKKTRQIKTQCWPRLSDPAKADAKQYPGWPVTISQMDNYNRKPAAWLSDIEVSGLKDPVIQVINESDNSIEYTIRIKGSKFQPRVFASGSYTVKVGACTGKDMQVFSKIKSQEKPGQSKIMVKF